MVQKFHCKCEMLTAVMMIAYVCVVPLHILTSFTDFWWISPTSVKCDIPYHYQVLKICKCLILSPPLWVRYGNLLLQTRAICIPWEVWSFELDWLFTKFVFFSLNNINLFHATWIWTVCQCSILIGLVRFVTCAAYRLVILNPHGRHHHGADGQLGRLSLCGSIGFAVLVVVIDIGGLKERAVSSTGGHRRGRAVYCFTSTLTLIFWHTEQRSNKKYSHTNILTEKECLE